MRRVAFAAGIVLLAAGVLILVLPYHVTIGTLTSPDGRVRPDRISCGPFITDGIHDMNFDGEKQDCWTQQWARLPAGGALIVGGGALLTIDLRSATRHRRRRRK